MRLYNILDAKTRNIFTSPKRLCFYLGIYVCSPIIKKISTILTVFNLYNPFVPFPLFNADYGWICFELRMKTFKCSFVWESDAYLLFVRECLKFRE